MNTLEVTQLRKQMGYFSQAFSIDFYFNFPQLRESHQLFELGNLCDFDIEILVHVEWSLG